MKLANFKWQLLAATVLPLLFASCKKESVETNYPVSQKDNSKLSGAIEDDLSVAAKLPVILSQEFFSTTKGISLKEIKMHGKSGTSGGGRKDNIAPGVDFSSPTSGAAVGGTLTVKVNASDNVAVALVSFYVDGSLAGSLSGAPYNFTWNSAAVSNGYHSLTAIAQDDAGNSSSAAIQVLVNNIIQGDITKPSVSITSPQQGASVSGTVAVSVAASDNVGVTTVALYADGALVSTKTSAPYSFNWNTSNVASGNHTLMAIAYDAAGNNNSNSVSVTLNTVIIPDNPVPGSYQMVMPTPRNQGGEGSCVSFAAVYAARSAEQYYKMGASSYSDATNLFSPEFTFNQVNMNGTCTVSSVVPTLDLLKTKGVCTWQSMPYSSSNGCSVVPTSSQLNEAAQFKISSYSTVVSSDVSAIKSMIARNHPVIVTCNIDQQFYNAGPGFIWKSFSNNSGYHAITLCGYDDSKHAYKAINSWGTNWGDQGFIWIDYDFLPTVSSYYFYVISL